jgi:hypothetical protein
MRWYRFHTDAWLHETFGMTPNEVAAYITVKCALFDSAGFVELNVALWSRRCGMRPSSFNKAIRALVSQSKIQLDIFDNGRTLVTCKAVTQEIETREKLAQKSEESRKKIVERRNEFRRISENVSSNTEYRIQKDNLRGSALPYGSGPGTKGSLRIEQPDVRGSRDSATSIAELRMRRAAAKEKP